MPVTAKLSKAFYDRLGEQVADELVHWFNDVDATYRTSLRELNDLNFARFDAKVEQRFVESQARVDRRIGELEVTLVEQFWPPPGAVHPSRIPAARPVVRLDAVVSEGSGSRE